MLMGRRSGLVLHLARYWRNLKLQERELSVIVRLGRELHMYTGVIYTLWYSFST